MLHARNIKHIAILVMGRTTANCNMAHQTIFGPPYAPRVLNIWINVVMHNR